MSLFSKIVTRSRIRKAARKLADDPCAKNYVALAREQVASGDMDQVSRVCTEGLQLHPNCAELQRLAERARHLKYEARAQTLQEELAVSPRPALWRELCQLMLEMGRVDRADKAAHDWYRTTKDGEALYFRALAHAERFYTDRRAEQGQIAHDLAREAQKLCKTDPRPIKLQLEIATRAGAWQDSRRLLARLLELSHRTHVLLAVHGIVAHEEEDHLPPALLRRQAGMRVPTRPGGTHPCVSRN